MTALGQRTGNVLDVDGGAATVAGGVGLGDMPDAKLDTIDQSHR